MRRGTPRRWATVVAAMASVGETIAPRTKAAAHGSPVTVWTTAPTTKVVISTSPTASSEIALMLARKSRHEVKIAETYKQRRQEQQEHELGIQLHRRQSRNEPERRSAENQQDRVRYLQPRGERGQRRHRKE